MARCVSLVRRIDCTGPWLAGDAWTARIPSFHLVSSLEETCQKSVCDGSQKLVFSRGVHQIPTDTTMFARVRGRMTKAFTTAVQCTMQMKSRCANTTTVFVRCGLECVRCLSLSRRYAPRRGNTMILASPSSRRSVSASTFTFDPRLLDGQHGMQTFSCHLNSQGSDVVRWT